MAVGVGWSIVVGLGFRDGVGGWLCPEGIDGVGWFFDLLLLGIRRLGVEGLGIEWAVVVGGGG